VGRTPFKRGHPRRLVCASVASLMAIAFTTEACSGNGDKQASVTNALATTTTAEPSETVPISEPATTTSAVAQEVTQRVRAEISEPVLGTWMTAAIVSAQAPADAVCSTPYRPMDGDTFERAAQVGDSVTSEMLLNLDAALGAAAEWCRRADPAAASAEYSDAQATAAAIQARLIEIGVR
jgi:hypothetical protein